MTSVTSSSTSEFEYENNTGEIGTTLEYSITSGLQPGETYQFKVRAVNTVGNSPLSDEVSY